MKPLVLIKGKRLFACKAQEEFRKEGIQLDIPTINLVRTGANITHLRKAAGLSVHDLQLAFGFNSPQAIYKWQNGTALPTVDNLIALAALLHVRMDDIIITDHSVA